MELVRCEPRSGEKKPQNIKPSVLQYDRIE